MSSPSPEQLIGPAAAKALAEHFDLTPKPKPLPGVVTEDELHAAWADLVDLDHGWMYLSELSSRDRRELLAMFENHTLRWLRSRLEALESSYSDPEIADRAQYGRRGHQWLERSDVFKALTGREWTP